MRQSYLKSFLLLAAFCVIATPVLAQKTKEKNKTYNTYKSEFCSPNNWSSGSKVSAQALRESTMTPGDVNVESKNGRITVIGEARNDVLVRACVRAWGETKEEAQARVDAVQIDTSSTIRANVDENDDYKVSIAYEIRVPNSTNLDLATGNGRLSIKDVDGNIRFKTNNGRVSLSGLSGNVEGQTNNGRVSVKLDGNSWNGSGMNVTTRNGRISLSHAFDLCRRFPRSEQTTAASAAALIRFRRPRMKTVSVGAAERTWFQLALTAAEHRSS